ncbi:hypothetical protein B0A48_17905 [Cryoendolithus antarcticus]|uniref:Uncharacterized protein n=1 Tax=Cryoendolithus antarcticus TaxID=1507870 RepID=A0A1V8SA06_9PEZI|nr:hypothetical protein B0A48_17905 [Cryoendolithus antarcticus]
MRSRITLLVILRVICTTAALPTLEQSPVVIDRDNSTRNTELQASNHSSALEELTDASGITHVIFVNYYSFEDQGALTNVTGGKVHRKSNDTTVWSPEALGAHNPTVYHLLLVLTQDGRGNGLLSARGAKGGWKLFLSNTWRRFKNLLRLKGSANFLAPRKGILEVAGETTPTLDLAGIGEPSPRELGALQDIFGIDEPSLRELGFLERNGLPLKKSGLPLKRLPTMFEETGQLPISVQQKDFSSSDFAPPEGRYDAEAEAWKAKSWEREELHDALGDARRELESIKKQTRLRNIRMRKAILELPGWEKTLSRQEAYMSHLKETNAAQWELELETLEKERVMLETGVKDRQLVASAFQARNEMDVRNTRFLKTDEERMAARLKNIEVNIEVYSDKPKKTRLGAQEAELQNALEQSKQLDTLLENELSPELDALERAQGATGSATAEQLQRLEQVKTEMSEVLSRNKQLLNDIDQTSFWSSAYKAVEHGPPPAIEPEVAKMSPLKKLNWLLDERTQEQKGASLFLQDGKGGPFYTNEGAAKMHAGTHYEVPPEFKTPSVSNLDGAADAVDGAVNLFEHGALTAAGKAPITQLPKELLAGYRKGSLASTTWIHKGDKYILDKAGRGFKAIASGSKQVLQGIKGGILEGAIEISDSIGALAPVATTEGAEAATMAIVEGAEVAPIGISAMEGTLGLAEGSLATTESALAALRLAESAIAVTAEGIIRTGVVEAAVLTGRLLGGLNAAMSFSGPIGWTVQASFIISDIAFRAIRQAKKEHKCHKHLNKDYKTEFENKCHRPPASVLTRTKMWKTIAFKCENLHTEHDYHVQKLHDPKGAEELQDDPHFYNTHFIPKGTTPCEFSFWDGTPVMKRDLSSLAQDWDTGYSPEEHGGEDRERPQTSPVHPFGRPMVF